MITTKEIITVSRDDLLAEKCDEVFTKENGWTKDECTVSVTYTRISGRLILKDSAMSPSARGMTVTELKKCPFCGGVAFVQKDRDQYFIKCLHKDICYLAGRKAQKYNIQEAMIKMWNRRVMDDDSGS